VRAAAVREMGSDEQERLRTLARSDPDARVRRVALRKLADPDVLEAIAQSDADTALRALAAERAREVLIETARGGGAVGTCEAALARLVEARSLAAVAIAAEHETVRRAALARTSGDRVLREVVRSATDPGIRTEALDRIVDAAVLRSIAVGDGEPLLALRAVERIADPATLRAIAEARTATKAVRQRARALLAERHAGTPVGAKATRARQVELCIAVHALRAERDVVRAAEDVREAEHEWELLAASVEPEHDVARRFRVACDEILDRAAAIARRRAAADRDQSAHEEAVAARIALCERIEALDGEDALRDLEQAGAAWSRLPALGDEEDAPLARRFAAAGAACAARHERWLAGANLRAVLEAMVAEAEGLADATPPPAPKRWKAIERRWAALFPSAGNGDPQLDELVRRLDATRERGRQRAHEVEARRSELERENLARLERLCARLDELATAETSGLRQARRELQAANAALADLGPLPPTERRAAWTERLSTARDALMRRLRNAEETEDWRRWANVGVQEEIIARVEALLESNDLAAGTRQLGRLQEEWAAAATATPEKSQVLWDRFRVARNELRKRCDAYLAENLERKRALCAQVAGVGEASGWNETTELIRRVQAEWKQIGPVPGKHAKALWQAFREPCDRFFARRKEHFDRVDGERREHAARKTALCEQAEALADSTDWDATAAALKQLQAEWKQIGPLPRAEAEALWQRFRTACDRFFDRRSRRDEIAREEALRRGGEICDALDALATELDGEAMSVVDDVGARVDAAWTEWLHRDLARVDAAQALNERLRVACERIVAARPEALCGTRLDPDVTRKRREKLCGRLEAMLPASADAPRAMSVQEMALALRERLATNTIAGAAGKQTNRQETARELERIEASWDHLGPLLDAESRALGERFVRARDRLKAAR